MSERAADVPQGGLTSTPETGVEAFDPMLAFVPVAIALLCPLDLVAAAAWALAVLAGATFARRGSLASLALAWIAHSVTGAPLAATAAASTTTRPRLAAVFVAATAPFLSLVWPPSLRNAGAVLIAACLVAIARNLRAARHPSPHASEGDAAACTPPSDTQFAPLAARSAAGELR